MRIYCKLLPRKTQSAAPAVTTLDTLWTLHHIILLLWVKYSMNLIKFFCDNFLQWQLLLQLQNDSNVVLFLIINSNDNDDTYEWCSSYCTHILIFRKKNVDNALLLFAPNSLPNNCNFKNNSETGYTIIKYSTQKNASAAFIFFK
jgi:hypothetical protein